MSEENKPSSGEDQPGETQPPEPQFRPSDRKDFTPLVPPVTLDKHGRIHGQKPEPEKTEQPSQKPSTHISSLFKQLNTKGRQFFKELVPKTSVPAKPEPPSNPSSPEVPAEKPITALPEEPVTDSEPSAAAQLPPVPVEQPSAAEPASEPASEPKAPSSETSAETPSAPTETIPTSAAATEPAESTAAAIPEPTAIPESIPSAETKPETPQYSQRVFLVHGADDRITQKVLPVLEKLGLKTFNFSEGTSEQHTLHERSSKNPDIGFAIVILSIEDMAYPKDSKPANAKVRVNQSVVFELGFLVAKLGRQRVFVLHPNKPNFELPTKYFDVYYTSFDEEGRWKRYLTDRLRACEYPIEPKITF